jgi:DNA topoisomerase IB
MMVVSDRHFEKADPVGVVTVHLPKEYLIGDVAKAYDKLWTLEHEGQKLVGGHSTANGQMNILNFSSLSNEDFAKRIDTKLGGKFSVDVRTAFVAFPQKADYGENLSSWHSLSSGQPSALGRADSLRSTATKEIENELTAHGKAFEGGQATERIGPLLKDWYEDDHPRVPAGSPDGGEFTSGGGSVGGGGADSSSSSHLARAELSGLHYDKPSKTWTRGDGKPVSAETAARLKLAGVKPAYTNVALNPDPDAPLQAKGQDVKGRTQYMYSKEHSEQAAAEKFSRLGDFNKVLPVARESLRAEMKNAKLPSSRRDAAAALSLIAQTGIRVGSDRETGGDVKAFGATTLLGKHVVLRSGGRIELAFPGKSGVLNKASTTDPDLHRYLSAKKMQPGQRIFSTNDVGVRVSMQRAAGSGFSPKDFRTWTGTAIALKEVARQPIPSNKRDHAKQRLLVAKVVAERLNNTPTVALKAYIDPAVFKSWGDVGAHPKASGELLFKYSDDQPRDESGRWSEEGGGTGGGSSSPQAKPPTPELFKNPTLVFGISDSGLTPLMSEYLAKHGQEFTPAPLPTNISPGKQGECYQNATLLIVGHPELSYVEGYGEVNGLPGLVFAHAWAVDKEGKVVDPTWKFTEKNRYFGVKYNNEKILALFVKQKVYGVQGKTDKQARAFLYSEGKGTRSD